MAGGLMDPPIKPGGTGLAVRGKEEEGLASGEVGGETASGEQVRGPRVSGGRGSEAPAFPHAASDPV